MFVASPTYLFEFPFSAQKDQFGSKLTTSLSFPTPPSALQLTTVGTTPAVLDNSNGDIEMLQFTDASPGPSMSMLVLHDDDEREFGYTAGAERALDLAGDTGWAVTSMRDEWASVFS